MTSSTIVTDAIAAIGAVLTAPPPEDARRLLGDTRREVNNANRASSGTVDWTAVLVLCTRILSEVGKDLNVVSYTLFSLHQTGGASALRGGVEQLTRLISERGESITPPNPTARSRSLGWSLNKIAPHLSALDPGVADYAHLLGLTASLRSLREACKENFCDTVDFGLLGPLDRHIRTLEATYDAPTLAGGDPPKPSNKRITAATSGNDSRTLEPVEKSETVAPPSTSGHARLDDQSTNSGPIKAHASPTHDVADDRGKQDDSTTDKLDADTMTSDEVRGTPHSVESPPVSTQDDRKAGGDSTPTTVALPEKTTRETSTRSSTTMSAYEVGIEVASLADRTRADDPANPDAHRLLRVAIWLAISAAPSPRANGRTRIPGLHDRDRRALSKLRDEGKWSALLGRCERLMVERPLDLNLQRLSAQALAGLGEDYEAARRAIILELRSLLGRLPSLIELEDKTGEPLADDETRRWIADEAQPRAATVPDNVENTSLSQGDDAFWDGLATSLRGNGRHVALGEAQQRINCAGSERARFTRQLALAEACQRVGLEPIAAALFSSLASRPDAATLAAWDPQLYARALAGQIGCPTKEIEPTEVLRRLGELDAAAAAAALARLPKS